jgi:chorismate mutase/prephenate dehydratase
MTKKEKEQNESPESPPALDARLQPLREGIDAIDARILNLINERLSLGKQIGDIKEASGSPVLDRSREQKVLDRLSTLNEGPLKNEVLHHLYSEIMAATRQIQQAEQIAYLGPEATFTHIAAMKHFKRSPLFLPQPSIQDVFAEVEKQICDYGVVPVENSSEGAVNHTLDLFVESDLKICAEIYQTISHDLLSTSGSRDGIKEIYSHPQALAQCRKWLRKHMPNCVLKECSSTTRAAQEASKTPDSAAIASSEAARLYDLRIVASRIEDFVGNTTRFLVIGKKAAPETGNDKTSIMFVTAHTPGALFSVMEPIAKADINLLKLESRPIKSANWNYCFFVDLEGHLNDAKVGETVKHLKSICQHLKWLGSYPRSLGEDA